MSIIILLFKKNLLLGVERMKEEEISTEENPLAVKSIGSLLVQYSVPGIVSMLVVSLYNMVDQFFIGNYVGELGNAATNVAFPLTALALGVASLFGVGGASAFNLALGRGEKEKATNYITNAAEMLLLCGVVICVGTLAFLEPLLRLFGAPDSVMPYAQSYVGITAFGYPFIILSNGMGHLIRADGRPRASMACNLSGGIINIILDTIFVVVLDYGIAGAATATVIGQVASAGLAAWFIGHTKTVKIRKKNWKLQGKYVGEAAKLGIAPALNQLATVVVQITMNNSLNYYGAMSEYGDAVPIAVVGIVTKVNQLYLGTMGGVSQAVQPVSSFNYGAKRYDRVRSVFMRAVVIGLCLGTVAFIMFRAFPRQIIGIFGSEASEEYFRFAERYFRIFLVLAPVNFLPQLASNFFTAIGKPGRGTMLSMGRQILFYLPLLVVLPMILGIDGIMYVGPVSDGLAVAVAVIMLVREFRKPEYRIKRRAKAER